MLAILRTALNSLRRDRPALALSFILPIAFFTIFAVIFGGHKDGTSRVDVIVVDEDHSASSQALLRGLQQESTLRVFTHPEATKKSEQPADYTAATAEAVVRAGKISVALIIPKDFGLDPISFGSDSRGPRLQMLSDSSDPVAPQVVSGMLQKTLFTSLGPALAEKGSDYFDMYVGGLTGAQRRSMEKNLAAYRHSVEEEEKNPAAHTSSGSSMLNIDQRTVVGETQNKPILSFYAAAVGVMFLLFTSSAAAGSLLDEAECGTLDRVLSTRVTMTRLLAGKLTYNLLLAFSQLALMFLWAWLIFHVDLPHHLAGFAIMGLTTAFAVAAFGIFLASFCHTRAQLGSISTLLVLLMSSLGGSMFPRYLMPAAMQKAGLFTLNAWAIDGFQKVFWYDLPLQQLWPQVSVLLLSGACLFLAARHFARRWDTA